MNNNYCAKRNAPLQRGAWECGSVCQTNSTPCRCCAEASRLNRLQDERDTRADLLSSLRIVGGMPARSILADMARSLRRGGLITAIEKRELLALFGCCGGAR
jgi:hypothetical protein